MLRVEGVEGLGVFVQGLGASCVLYARLLGVRGLLSVSTCVAVIWRARLVTCACLHVPTRCILPPIKSPLMLRFMYITAPPPASWCLRRCSSSSACCGHHLHSLMLRLKHFDASSMLMPGAC